MSIIEGLLNIGTKGRILIALIMTLLAIIFPITIPLQLITVFMLIFIEGIEIEANNEADKYK